MSARSVEEIKEAFASCSEWLSNTVLEEFGKDTNSLNLVFSKKQLEVIMAIAELYAKNLILEFNAIDVHHPDESTSREGSEE